jgi:hypothetical protein
MADDMKTLAVEIDRVANEIATATLADCEPDSAHEAIVAGFKAGAAWVLARLIQERKRRGN